MRIMRADLPRTTAQAIYARMQTEREREARTERAQGAEASQRIRAEAERDRTVLLAEAQRQAQVLRGQGDAEATRIFAEAFNQDPQFYSFYRSLQAYRTRDRRRHHPGADAGERFLPVLPRHDRGDARRAVAAGRPGALASGGRRRGVELAGKLRGTLPLARLNQTVAAAHIVIAPMWTKSSCRTSIAAGAARAGRARSGH